MAFPDLPWDTFRHLVKDAPGDAWGAFLRCVRIAEARAGGRPYTRAVAEVAMLAHAEDEVIATLELWGYCVPDQGTERGRLIDA